MTFRRVLGGWDARFKARPSYVYSLRELFRQRIIQTRAMDSQPPEANRRQRSLRILCADDNTLLGDILIKVFSLAGHSAEHVADGAAAWERMANASADYDILVTDHRMPGLSGLELVERLRQANFPGRIIVHSAALAEKDTQAYRLMAVDAIVVKPAAAEALLGIVEAFIEA